MYRKIYPITYADNNDNECLMMSLFLDFLMKDAIQNPSMMVPYAQEINDEIDDLLADVVID